MPKAYEFDPDLPPPVFEGAPLPIREFQVLSTVNDSLFMRSDFLPASLHAYSKSDSIEDIVREFEESDESIDTKNARLIGILALMTDAGLAESSTIKSWQLAPHLGMLNAIGAALSAGLVVSEDSLRAAVAFHHEYSDHSKGTLDDPYTSPGADSAIQAIKRTISAYASMDVYREEKGVEKYISYYTYDIDRQLYAMPPGLEAIASYAEDEEARHMVDLYHHIIAQIEAARSAVLGREDEIGAYLERVYERIAQVQADLEAQTRARGVQDELPGLESSDNLR